MDYKTHNTTSSYLERVRSHKEPYTTEVLSKEIIVYPNVMSPKYDWSPRFHIENMPNQKDKDFLEIGCGSGVLSLFASFQGANKIVAVDINPNAVKNTKANFQKYNIKNFDVHESDVFEKVTGKFDTINFAAPYHGNKPIDILEYGVSDPEYRALKLFLKNAKNFLKENGQIILGFSNTGDLDLLNTLFIENKLHLKNFKEEENNGWKAYLYILEPIKFNSKKQEYIYDDDYIWFKKYKNLIISGNILKVGYGIGFTSYFIKLFNKNIVNIDITVNQDSLDKNNVKIYDGRIIPFPENIFDVVLCTYTLHHSENPESLFGELYRVSKSKVIIIEETYKNIFQKIQLIFFCWFTNRKAGQKVNIILSSYLSTNRFLNLFKKGGLNITQKKKISRRSYMVELLVGSK
jgi:methylase of polypeptide subunit release factors